MRQFWIMGLVGLVCLGQTQTTIRRAPIETVLVHSGDQMYSQYCASCHGMDGKGSGAAAAALREGMPDLTKMAQNNGGEFPSMSVLMTLGRIQGPGAHGSEEMPVWGELFRRSGQNEATVQLRIYNLMRHLESLQDPPSRKAPAQPRAQGQTFNPARIHPVSGASMYASLCASCHGEPGIGDGPVGVSLKNMPTDLTMLSRNNNGSFPSTKITEILERNPGVASHGTATMPIWGSVFRGAGEDPTVVRLRIYNLVNYLRALQR